MKNLLIFVFVTLLFSCQKEEGLKVDSLEGKWELRHVLGVQVAGAPSHFEKGNGNIIEFSKDHYKGVKDGRVLTEGTYTIVKESAEIDGNKYENRIIFGDDSWKVFIKVSGNTLLICTGSIVSDGNTSTYVRRY